MQARRRGGHKILSLLSLVLTSLRCLQLFQVDVHFRRLLALGALQVSAYFWKHSACQRFRVFKATDVHLDQLLVRYLCVTVSPLHLLEDGLELSAHALDRPLHGLLGDGVLQLRDLSRRSRRLTVIYVDIVARRINSTLLISFLKCLLSRHGRMVVIFHRGGIGVLLIIQKLLVHGRMLRLVVLEEKLVS